MEGYLDANGWAAGNRSAPRTGTVPASETLPEPADEFADRPSKVGLLDAFMPAHLYFAKRGASTIGEDVDLGNAYRVNMFTRDMAATTVLGDEVLMVGMPLIVGGAIPATSAATVAAGEFAWAAVGGPALLATANNVSRYGPLLGLRLSSLDLMEQLVVPAYELASFSYPGSTLGRLGSAAAVEGSARLTVTEVNALRNAGYTDAEIARHIDLMGDIYLFRGTSTGWPGSPGAQATRTSASPDPYSATVFALEARAAGGEGVVMYGGRSQIGAFDVGSWIARQEREVGVLLKPSEFAEKAPKSIPVDSARQVLADMGFPPLPYAVQTSRRGEYLEAVPRMTPDQVAEFLRRINR
jgi:hypothetical protein